MKARPGRRDTSQPPAATAAPSTSPSMLEILRAHDDFRNLSIGTVTSQAGQWILNVALAWAILELTDSALYVGLLGFAAGVPMILASVPAGIVLDRFDRRSILIACQLGMLLAGVGLLFFVATETAAPAHLLGGMFFYGALMALNNAGRQTVVPGTVPRTAMAAAFGLTSAATHASRIVGPSIAGLLIGVWGVSAAIVFQIVIVTVALVATIALSGDVNRGAAPGRRPGGVLEGFRYARRNRLVLHLAILAAIPMFFAFPYLQLLPVIARDILAVGPDGLGLMLAMSGAGAIAGGLLTERAARFGPVGLFMLVATIAYGGIVLVIAFSTSVWLTVPAIMTGSLTGSMFQSLNNTLFQLQLDDEVRGRVTGVYMLGFGTYALGGLPLGYLADRFSPPLAIACGALASSACAMLLLARSPDLRALRSA